jgi:magnesium transporter
MSQSRFFHIGVDGRLRQVGCLEEALSGLKDGGYLWLDFFDPQREDLIPLTETLGVHPLSIEDCVDESQIPKVENFSANTFIVLNSYGYVERRLVVEEIDLIVGANFVVSVSGHGGGELCVSERLQGAASQDPGKLRQGPDFLLHLIADYIVDSKYLAVEALQEEIDAAETDVIENLSQFKLEQFAGLRKDLLALRKSLFHEREILIKLCRRDSPYISEKAIYHYRDIYDHLAKFFEEAELYREMIMNLMEMYLSMLNNRMTLTANRTNITLRRLTFIATIFMPLTLVASIGGMSEWSMMTGPENWRISYPLFMLAMAMLGVGTYLLLRWLDAKSAREGDSGM